MTFFVNIQLNVSQVVLFVWFIVKISFVKKKNCPGNLNYYTTFRIRPCSHAVSLIPLSLMWTFLKPVYIYLSIYMRVTADPTRRAQLRKPVAVANLLGLALFRHILIASHVGFPVDLSLTQPLFCAKYILTFNFCCLAPCCKPDLYLLFNK